MTEVTTRRLETHGQPFVNVHDAPTGHAPLEPQGRTEQVSGIETQRLRPASSKLNKWLPGMVLLLILTLLSTVYLLRLWRRTTAIPVAPPAPERPAIPQPPKPPAPPGQATGTAIDPGYIYPGARQTMIVSKPGKGDMVQLETEDSLDKVSDWYIDKFKPAEIVRQPDSTVLRTEKLAVIISSNGKGTNIMLRQGPE